MRLPIRKIIVVGGGSAGLPAAISIRRRNPAIAIDVVRSAAIKPIGVGESTIQTVPKYLHGYLGIDPTEFFREVNPTWKLGIRFLWGPRDHFHYSFRPQVDLHYEFLSRSMGFFYGDRFEYGELASSLCEHDRVFARRADGTAAVSRDWAYHFDNRKLVEFLESHARRIGIGFVDDTIQHVEVGEQGVSRLQLEYAGAVSADFYIDCSGFRAVLIGEALGQRWIDFKTSLYCDRTIVGNWHRPQGQPIQPYTTAETMDAGWCWQIDHEHSLSRGYVYSSDFISDEAAETEFRAKNPLAGETRLIHFAVGRRSLPWVGNVVAIGNANGFVEPLESTALHVICQDAKAVAESLAEFNGVVGSSIADEFNRRSEAVWNAVRQFLAIHYKFNTRLNTPFWQACRADVDICGAAPIVEYWRQNGPSSLWAETLVSPHDFFGLDGYFTHLLGQQVPFETSFVPTEREQKLAAEVQAAHRKIAESAMTTEEALAIVRSPDWKWPAGVFD